MFKWKVELINLHDKISRKLWYNVKKEVILLALVLTLNPSLDKWYWISDFDKGKSFYVKDYKYTIGGGGINVAKIINEFNEEAMVVGFVGGDSGRRIVDQLDKLGIRHKLVSIESESPYTIRIVSENDIVTEVVEEGPSISSDEVSKLYRLFEEEVSKWDYVCLCENLPKSLPKDFLYNLIILSKKYNKKFFLSTGGLYLKAGIEAIPYFVCLTKEELENYLGCSVNSNLEVIQAGKYLAQDGIEIIMFFLGIGDVCVFYDEYIYMVRMPNIKVVNSTGIRDSIVGGYITSLLRGYDFEFSLKVSVACGLANALVPEPGKIDIADMKRIMNDLVIIKSRF